MKRIDLTGKRFRKLLVLSVSQVKDGRVWWRCLCDCGNETSVITSSLRKKAGTQSCGCIKAEKVKRRLKTKYGRWTIVSQTENNRFGENQFLCRCDCGNTSIIKTGTLFHGKSRSCGCIQKLPNGEAAKRQLIVSYIRSAKRRGVEWGLDSESFSVLTKGNCRYCGTSPSQKHKSGLSIYVYNGLDRVDNDFGYLPSNVVPCCKTCNTAKMSLSVADFLSWVSRVYIHSVGHLTQ